MNPLLHLTEENKTENLAGVYFNGVQYYDMSSFQFFNNTEIIDLIELVKTWSELGVDVKFINLGDAIKTQINELDLESVIVFE